MARFAEFENANAPGQKVWVNPDNVTHLTHTAPLSPIPAEVEIHLVGQKSVMVEGDPAKVAATLDQHKSEPGR